MVSEKQETTVNKGQKRIRNSLVILVWNELEALKKLYPMIPLNAVDEAIVIDGGSTDGSVEFLKKKGLKIYTQKERGRGHAFREGLKHANGENLIFFSGDGNENPKDIPKVVKLLEQGYDMVVAGRFVRKGSQSDNSDDPIRLRKLGGIVYGLSVQLLWGGRVYDAINGFRGIKKSAMKKMNLDAPKHEIELQSTIRAAKLGLKVKEIPTHELLRMGGLRKKTAGTLTLGKELTKTLIKEIFVGKKF